MIKVLLLNYEFPPLGGGAANATKYILKEFSKYSDIQIDLVTSSTSKFRVEKFSKNINIHYLDIGKNNDLHNQSNMDLLTYSYKAYKYCKKLKKNKRYDLCHAFFGIPCGFLADKLKFPYIVSLRGSDVPFYSEKYKLLDTLFFQRMSKKIWEKSEYTIANSNGLKDLADKTNANKEIGVIFNGIDTKEFQAKKKYDKKGKIRILCIGRLIQRKGYKYLIEAAKNFKDDIRIDFVGDGPLKEELMKQCEGLETNFFGLLDHDEISKISTDYDVFVLPSFNEGMSNTVLEAMASGLALIVTDTGGTKELVNGNGFIVKTGSSKDIENKLKKYIDNRDLVEKHGRKSRDLAMKMSWENVAKQYYEKYKSIVKKKKILVIAPQPFFEIRGTPIAMKDMMTILGEKYDIDFLSYSIGKNIKLDNVKQYRSFSFGIKKVDIGFSLKKVILDIGMYFKTRKLIRRNKYDYIHANEEAAWWCSKFAEKKGVPFIYDMDSIMSEQLDKSNQKILTKIMKKAESKIVKRSNLILGVSNNFKSYCKSLDEDCNYVSIWDVPQTSESIELSSKYKKILDNKKKKVLYIGNDQYVQGISHIENVAPRFPEMQFIIIGTGINKVEDNITYVDKIPMEMVKKFMEECDVLMAPRRYGTNTPMKVYSYMESGKPIVATTIKAHNLLRDCAILVGQTENEFEEGIKRALSKEGKELGKKAKEKVKREYSFEKLKKKVLDSYEEL